jgi:hypothetical protein
MFIRTWRTRFRVPVSEEPSFNANKFKHVYLSSVGSVRMSMDLLDLDPLVRGTDPDPSIIKQNLDSYCFVTSL